MGLVWGDIVRQAALSVSLAAWETQDPRYKADRAIHVRDAGFKGLVGYHPDTLADMGEEYGGEEDAPDHHADHLMDFTDHHGSNRALWEEKATFGPVDLRHGVYATQSHVHPDHVTKYRDDPSAPTERLKNVGLSEYLGDHAPMFVTHQGRLHTTEGHHRVAAALQRGDSHITGWHYDADRHGFPPNEDDDEDWGH
ncbi:hypothetical protein ACPCSE_29660 [Streptomyces cellulosae]